MTTILYFLRVSTTILISIITSILCNLGGSLQAQTPTGNCASFTSNLNSPSPHLTYFNTLSFGAINNSNQGTDPSSTNSGSLGNYLNLNTAIQIGVPIQVESQIVSVETVNQTKPIFIGVYIKSSTNNNWYSLSTTNSTLNMPRQNILPASNTTTHGHRFQDHQFSFTVPTTLANLFPSGEYVIRFVVAHFRPPPGVYNSPCNPDEAEAEDYFIELTSTSPPPPPPTCTYCPPSPALISANHYISGFELQSVNRRPQTDDPPSLNQPVKGYRLFDQELLEFRSGSTYTGTVDVFYRHVNQLAGETGYLGCWLDRNGNGEFADIPDEEIILQDVAIPPNTSNNPFSINTGRQVVTVPFTIQIPQALPYTGASMLRCVFHEEELPSPITGGVRGEVEDYPVRFTSTEVENLPSYAALSVHPGAWYYPLPAKQPLSIWFNHRYSTETGDDEVDNARYSITTLSTGDVTPLKSFPLRRGINRYRISDTQALPPGDYLLSVSGVDLDETRYLRFRIGS